MDENRRFKEGTHVKHILKLTEGRILGVTRIRSLFEQPDNSFEYRVQTREGIKIYSPTNLELQSVTDAAGTLASSRNRTETGRYGVQLVCDELAQLGYEYVGMPDNNPGFDLNASLPSALPSELKLNIPKRVTNSSTFKSEHI